MHLVCPVCGATNRVADERLFQHPVCGKCGADLMATEPVPISEQALAKFIEKTELPVLIDFWADWCDSAGRWHHNLLKRREMRQIFVL
jgi:thioredoxin 2